MDNISLTRLKRLHPLLRDEALKIYNEINTLLTGRAKLIIIFTLRTFKEQQDIYNQGRTTKGEVVTNAKPGQSYHNYGLAIDIALYVDNKSVEWNMEKDYDGDTVPDWKEAVKIFKKYGWNWGGDWKSLKDYPHFEKTFGHNWRELLELHNSGKVDSEGYVIIKH